MNKLLAVSFLLSSMVILSACSTVKGVGKDLQVGGAKVEELSKKTSKKL